MSILNFSKSAKTRWKNNKLVFSVLRILLEKIKWGDLTLEIYIESRRERAYLYWGCLKDTHLNFPTSDGVNLLCQTKSVFNCHSYTDLQVANYLLRAHAHSYTHVRKIAHYDSCPGMRLSSRLLTLLCLPACTVAMCWSRLSKCTTTLLHTCTWIEALYILYILIYT